MQIQYPNQSAYSLTPQSSWSIGRYVHKTILPDVSDVTTTIPIEYQYRPDKWAYDLYGDVGYQWVFMSRNPGVIIDPVFGFTVGLEIVIPTLAVVQKAQ